MYQGRRVVSVTPFGRRRYVELLAHYLLDLRDVIDEHQFWINTQCREDLDFVHDLADCYPDFFKLIKHRARYATDGMIARICPFWRQCNQPDTLYLKFDDDLVWMADGAIEKLLDFRLANPSYLIVFPNTINNSLCSHLHQRMGILPPEPPIEYECTGEISWRRWQTARECHETFFKHHKAGHLDRYRFDRWELTRFERFSINAMCWFGHDLAPWVRQFTGDDEHWTSQVVPERTGRTTCITGDSLVAHFAYGPQREGLEANTQTLDRYRAIVPRRHRMNRPRILKFTPATVGERLQHVQQTVLGLFNRRRSAA
jgi:hypothetical protein